MIGTIEQNDCTFVLSLRSITELQSTNGTYCRYVAVTYRLRRSNVEFAQIQENTAWLIWRIKDWSASEPDPDIFKAISLSLFKCCCRVETESDGWGWGGEVVAAFPDNILVFLRIRNRRRRLAWTVVARRQRQQKNRLLADRLCMRRNRRRSENTRW